MAGLSEYNPRYTDSWAMVVGVNAYTDAPKLGFAANDAVAFAEKLEKQFAFPRTNITLLLDKEATIEKIRGTIARFVESTNDDDRVVIFFAGHGHTRSGRRGDVGYLVPVGGRRDDTATLLPWQELVHNGDLIRAKHVLFVMDACYSGLIAKRALAPGSTRIARDMLSRYSRQYLTAGKADEVVADSGGPRKGHSMFTGHLLDALDGKVASRDGIITANAVIAYVYDRVSRDPFSRQTPHYGWLDGDGDLFFTHPKVDPDPTRQKDTDDLFIEVPPSLEAPTANLVAPILDNVKLYLSERKYRIQLNDLIVRELRAAQRRLGEDNFPVQPAKITPADIVARLHAYEESLTELLKIIVLIGRWAEDEQQLAIRQIVNMLAGQIDLKGGSVLWLGLRFYPMLLAMYAGGIGAVEGNNYRSLQTLFATQVVDHKSGVSKTQPVLQSTVGAILEADRADAFKIIPNFEQKYVPRSEYLFTKIQPIVDDVLVLGTRYEQLFDRFEVFYALCCADLDDSGWGPPGRFAWKYVGSVGRGGPFVDVVEEASREGDSWAPLKAGMFGGSHARFREIAERYKSGLLNRLGWW